MIITKVDGANREFDLDHDSVGLTRPASRDLTELEIGWINAILEKHPVWSDVSISNVRVDGECTCGCRTVHFTRPDRPQNPRTAHLFHETIGFMWISTEEGGLIGITLHAKLGSIGELEVVYNENADPWPAAWREVSRKLIV